MSNKQMILDILREIDLIDHIDFYEMTRETLEEAFKEYLDNVFQEDEE